MIDEKDRKQVTFLSNCAYFIVGVDLLCATACAIGGSNLFIAFMVLMGVMWAYAAWLRYQLEEKGE